MVLNHHQSAVKMPETANGEFDLTCPFQAHSTYIFISSSYSNIQTTKSHSPNAISNNELTTITIETASTMIVLTLPF